MTHGDVSGVNPRNPDTKQECTRLTLNGAQSSTKGSLIMNTRHRLAVLLLTGAATLGGSLAAAPIASAEDFTQGAVTVNCSWGSCSMYLSRSATKELNSRVENAVTGGAAVGTAVCTALGVVATPIAGAACGLGAASVLGNAYLAKDSIKEAAEQHGPKGACFKVTKAHASAQPYYSTNNGRFCKN